MHPVKLEKSNNLEATESSKNIRNNNKFDSLKTESITSYISSSEDDKKDDNDLLINESLDWYDEEEIKILSFYVSFLLIYSLYLNEKNSQMNEFD
jgi:hypothetical protein